MHGVMMPTNLAGKYLDEAEFNPFWDALAAEGKPLFLHPANAPCQANWNKYSSIKKFSGPPDSTLALSRIVYCGVLDRYPNLKLIASHLGGMILLYHDRLNWREQPGMQQSRKNTPKRSTTTLPGRFAPLSSSSHTTRWARTRFSSARTILMAGRKGRSVLSDDPKRDERAGHPESG